MLRLPRLTSLLLLLLDTSANSRRVMRGCPHRQTLLVVVVAVIVLSACLCWSWSMRLDGPATGVWAALRRMEEVDGDALPRMLRSMLGVLVSTGWWVSRMGG